MSDATLPGPTGHAAPEEPAEAPGVRLGPTALFVQRPVLAAVLNLLIVVAGLAALAGIEVRELPNVDRPVISVRTTYEGASAETIDAQVTSVLEDALAQTPGIKTISSSSSYGSSSITLEFSSATGVEAAASDVRDLVSRAARTLPEAAEDPVVTKSDADADPIMRLSLIGGGVPLPELSRLAEERIAEELSSIDGVAEVSIFGDRRDIMRVSLLPVALASRGLTVEDLQRALSDAALDAPSGTVETETSSLVVRSTAKAETAESISNIFVDASTRVGDVAFVEMTGDDTQSVVRVNGLPAISLNVVRQAQSNTLAISEAIRDRLPEIRRQLPEGVELLVASDDGLFIERSIEEVVLALLISTVVVIAVIFLFLGSLRATLIPALTIPVSLIGTLAAIWAVGFSINTITLLGLVLATGLVVDDAIIVLENIERRRREGLGRRAAAVLGSREVFFAVVATTATLAAVFVPISFLPGQAGQIFSEFGFVLAFSVLVSSFTALTLVPVLAAKLDIGKPEAEGGRRGLVSRAYRGLGGLLARLYYGLVELALRMPFTVVAAALIFALVSFGLYRLLPSEITPPEDRGFFFVIASAPTGASLPFTNAQVERIEAILAPYRESGEIATVQSIVGRGRSNTAFVIARLADWEERVRSQQEIQGEINRKFQPIPGVRVFARSGNSLGIRGGGSGLTVALTGADYDGLAASADKLVAALQKEPGFSNPQVSFDVSQPQLSIAIDRDRASDLGVELSAVTALIRTMVEGQVAAELYLGDEIVDVKLVPGGRPVDDQTDLENLFVKTAEGGFVPLSALVTIQEEAASPSLPRQARARAVTVQANLDAGQDLGQAIERVRALKTEVIGDEASLVLTGEAATFEESNTGVALVFVAAIVVVLLVLAAQFESVVSALIIMATVPFGLGAALVAILLTGGSLNFYSQIGLVMLVGIMAKNGILVVEFANQLRDRGASVGEAVRKAVRLRFRPVMMTMVATVVGGLPLVLATGPGAEARTAIGWVIVGGLGFATVFTLFLVPVFYFLFARLSKPRAEEEKMLRQELASAGS